MTRVPLDTLLVAGLLLLAGCTSGSQITSPAGQSNDTTPTTTMDTLDTKPYPERPSNLTRDTALDYTKSFEQAYLWNRLLTPNTTNINVNIVSSNVTTSDEGYIVNLQVTYSEDVARAGLQHGLNGNGNYTVAYFLNDTTTVRARTGGQMNVNPVQWGGRRLDALEWPEPAPKQLPQRPATLTNSSILAFVSEYEKNYVWMQKLEEIQGRDNPRYVDVAIERELLVNTTDNGYVVHLLVAFGWATGKGDTSMEADGVYVVNYFVNESVVKRAAGGKVGSRGPDPRTNGTVVET